MADTTNQHIHIPFGVGTVISDTFSIFFRKIHIVLLLGFIPALVDVVLSLWLFDSSFETTPAADIDWAAFWPAFAGLVLVSMVAVAFTSAMVIQFAYDTKLNRPAQIGRYFASAFNNLPAIAILSIITGILTIIGWVMLVVPGIWLYAVFSVVVPAIVIDRAGFGAIGRSAELTKNYRWPIVGALILIVLCIFLFAAAIGFVFGLALLSFDSQGAEIISESIGSAIGYGWTGVAIAMIFARLKEIKEGVSVSDLADVFR